MADKKDHFAGSFAENYDRHMAPLIFDPYAADLAERLQVPAGGRVLETAAGTGIVTRFLRDSLPKEVQITATDLNETMLEQAQRKFGSEDNVTLQLEDAQALSFADDAFDAVVCQFGIMFFPDKLASLHEVRRVLKPGGLLLFNVWDAIEYNDLLRTTNETLTELFPNDPPGLFHIVFGYHSMDAIRADMETAGFGEMKLTVLPHPCTSPTASQVAIALMTGTPISQYLAQRTQVSQEVVAQTIEDAVANAYGREPVQARMQAIVIQAENP